MVVRFKGWHGALTGGDVVIVAAKAQADDGHILIIGATSNLKLLLRVTPFAMAGEQFGMSMGREKAEQGGTARLLFANAYAAEVITAGGNVDDPVEHAIAGEFLSWVVYSPAAEVVNLCVLGAGSILPNNCSQTQKRDKNCFMTLRQHGVLLLGRSSHALIWRIALLALVAGLVVFASLTAIKALEEAFHNDQFPEALAVKVEQLPIIFPVHMITGGLALWLVPLALALRPTRWHRLAGRVAGVDILVAGITAIPVAYVSPVTTVSAAGFIAQALTWMALFAAGSWNIRQRNIEAHKVCMLLMAAVTSGAMFFRIYLALWAVYGTRAYFKVFYACDAWIAWSLPLMVMGLVLWLSQKSRQAVTV